MPIATIASPPGEVLARGAGRLPSCILAGRNESTRKNARLTSGIKKRTTNAAGNPAERRRRTVSEMPNQMKGSAIADITTRNRRSSGPSASSQTVVPSGFRYCQGSHGRCTRSDAASRSIDRILETKGQHPGNQIRQRSDGALQAENSAQRHQNDILSATWVLRASFVCELPT